MDEPNIQTLNELLRGEHMAIEGYENVLPSIEKQQTREEINKILRDHKEHAAIITERVISLGGMPKESTGMVGVMSQAKLKAEGFIKSDKSLLKRLLEGESKGIAKVEKIIEGDLDSTSMQMVQNILDTDYGHLKKLRNMIDSYY